MLDCSVPHEPAFLRTDYSGRPAAPAPHGERPAAPTGGPAGGLFRHAGLLPVVRTFPGIPGPLVYHAERLGRRIGLDRLWVAWNGHWPERGTTMPTCTFKDLEAYTVLGRLPARPPVLVIPSAGNTAAAFAWACTLHRVPCLLVIPSYAMERMRFPGPLDPCVRLVVLDGAATYGDAIACADLLARLPGHQAEGGSRNVARRDGLGTVMLAAAEALGRLPETYVQAVGSATGAIGAHEAARRLRTGGQRLPRLLMCQSAPYAPVRHAWRSTPGETPGRAHDAVAPELTNRKPPFMVRGGVRDALTESGGDVLCAGNEAALAAMALFEDVEGTDIEPGAGVALAALADAARSGLVRRDELVLLNITGGGRARLARGTTLVSAEPWIRIPWPGDAESDARTAAAEQVRRLLSYVTAAQPAVLPAPAAGAAR